MKNSRILLKLSGEALLPKSRESVIDVSFASFIARQIKEVVESGIQTAVVIGGGNIFRGAIGESLGMDRVKGDYMGMIATVINGLAVESALENLGVGTAVFSPVADCDVVKPFNQREALAELDNGKVVICSGGTGNPYFTTDTAAALRAVELGCGRLLKATKVKGVYSDDPMKKPDATFFPRLSYDEVLSRNLRVMDQTAFSLCRDNRLPIIVFNVGEDGNIVRAASGEDIGTLIS